MEIFYSHYRLQPLKRLNRNSNMDPKEGVYLKAVRADQVSFADYFPHAVFGDKGCEQFLHDFQFQKDTYEQKILQLLHKDALYQKQSYKRFYNHQLWTGTEDLEAPVIKYKLLRSDDKTYLDPLKRGLRLRLDANALFNRETFHEFLCSIPQELHRQIDYVEDPTFDKEWQDLGIKVARDLFEGKPHDYYIYRPNCEFYPEHEKNIIFSSYLGSDFGRWHVYCELIERGDLDRIHGIISNNFFENQRHFLKGNYQEGFMPDGPEVKSLYQELSQLPWKSLCKM